MNNSTDPGDPVSIGEPRNMVVVCSDPKTVWGIVAGVATWMVTETVYVRGGIIYGGEFYYACGKKVRVRNPATGAFIRDYDFPESTFINCFWVGLNGGVLTLVVIYSGDGPDLIKVYDITSTITLLHTSPVSVSHCRGVYIDGDRLVVASTFEHQVKVISISGGATETYTSVWYPNDVRKLSDGRTLITAEHENRIFKWDRVTNGREMVASAPLAPFNDIAKTRVQIEAETPASSAEAPDYTPVYSPPKQNVAKIYHPGEVTLYAPNACFQAGSDLWVADTDDCRVIIIRDGAVVTEVHGLNNPVGVAMF